MHAYTNALIEEMRFRAEKARGYTVDTVFFGGGTPTILPISDIKKLAETIKALFCIAPDAEITVEANPATASEDKLLALRSLGVNRLSVGVQSLSDGELSALGRAHTAADAARFFHAARVAGFSNVSVDLMYGIPYQTKESFARTLDGVLALNPEHISAYSLILEEGTPFFEKSESLPLPDEDTEAALHALLCEKLSAHGYRHYEISNFAKDGFLSRHNLHYWRAEEYLGFGASAYSFFGGERWGNEKSVSGYISAPAASVFEREILSPKDEAYEYIMLRLRLDEGIDVRAYEARFGVKIKERFRDEILQFKAEGIIEENGSRLFLTEKGMRFSNTVLVAFMEDF